MTDKAEITTKKNTKSGVEEMKIEIRSVDVTHSLHWVSIALDVTALYFQLAL